MEKRILVYTNHFYPENFRINEIAFILSKTRFKVHVISCIPNYPKGKFFKGYSFFKKRNEYLNHNLKVTRLPLIPRGNGSKLNLVINYFTYFISTFFYTAYLILFKKKYDYILVHHTSPIFIAVHPIVYKIFRKNKIILWDLDMWPDTLQALNIISNRNIINLLESIMKNVYKSYDKILIGSNSFFEIAQKRVEASKIEFFPNWAEDVYFNKIKKPKNILFFPSGFNILYAGNIGEAQDFNTIINSAKELNSHSVNFIFIGDGRFKNEFYNKLEKLNIDNIYLYNYQDIENIPYYFSISDALLLTLKNKDIFNRTVPAKLQSYMSAKKPIIGIINGEGKKIIKNSNCGITVLPGEERNFTKKILDLKYSDNKYLEGLGNNAYKYYMENFDFNLRYNQLINILE